ncbi:unnamed protein product [Staurois parvus]|uniref:Uncharacterized protein n=1 Tax=Staurois parvus TaxID=386267 RepID=A0ABN9GT20_9NEOB|nr:unnamed protein product [Staurois parvus]
MQGPGRADIVNAGSGQSRYNYNRCRTMERRRKAVCNFTLLTEKPL